MSVFEKHRFRIFSNVQHPYKHPIGDFAYSNERLPNVTTLEDALNYIVSSIYPNYKGTVATPGDLPGGATLNDYYIVTDDGDGKSAGYIYSSIDGTTKYIKRYDVDWSMNNILAEAVNSTMPVYVHKWGTQDRDDTGSLFIGDLAGQRIYGSNTANEHLILYANSGDAVGNTGYVQFGDDSRPLVDSSFDFGTDTYRWANIYTDNLISGTLTATSGSITDSSGSISFGDENISTTGTLGAGVATLASGSLIGNLTLSNGSITDSSGSISFDNENLSTTGTLAASTTTIASTLILASGSITDTSGTISFGNENLITTGTLNAGATTLTQATVDDILLNNNSVSISTLDTDLILSANGTGVVDVQSALTTLGITSTGVVDITGSLTVDNIDINGQTISTNFDALDLILSPHGAGVVELTSNIRPSTSGNRDLGESGSLWQSLYLNGNLNNGTNSFVVSELMTLRNVPFRDAARTQAVQDGDSLFYDSISGTWLASAPDSEIVHNTVSGLTDGDAGHTQFALLAGRSGGQALIGGVAASENLDLESTSDVTKGDIRVKDDLIPFTNASYSASWSGTDIGGTSNYFRDLYTKGEAKGLRIENYVLAGLPSSSSANAGRLTYATDNEKLYVDTGSTMKVVSGVNKFISDVSFDGLVTTKDVDVSSTIVDARNATRQLFDNSNDYEQTYVSIKAISASNIRITTNLPLPAGSYRLVVLEEI